MFREVLHAHRFALSVPPGARDIPTRATFTRALSLAYATGCDCEDASRPPTYRRCVGPLPALLFQKGGEGSCEAEIQ